MEELPACQSQGNGLERAMASNASEPEKTVDISMRIGSPKVSSCASVALQEEDAAEGGTMKDDSNKVDANSKESVVVSTSSVGDNGGQAISLARPASERKPSSPIVSIGISPGSRERSSNSKEQLEKSKSMCETYGEDDFDEYEDDEFDEDASDGEEDGADGSKVSAASCSKKEAVDRSSALSAPLSNSVTATSQVDRPGSAGSAVSARSARSTRSRESARSQRSRSVAARSNSSGSSRSRSRSSSRSRSASSAGSQRSPRSPVSIRSAHDTDDEKNEI